MTEARCETCGTTYQCRNGDEGIEIYNPLRNEWSSSCPHCGGPTFDVEVVSDWHDITTYHEERRSIDA